MPPTIDSRIPDLVSITEAAHILGIHRQAVNGLINRGALPAKRVGTTWVMLRDTVDQHAAARRAKEKEGAG